MTWDQGQYHQQPTLNGTDAAMARAIMLVASFGLVAKPTPGGTYAASRRP
jgi:hypothetical protein